MKILLFSVYTVSVLAASTIKLESHLKNQSKLLIVECKNKTGASDADMDSMKNYLLPNSHEGLCMMECVFDATKIMVEGKFNKKGVMELFGPVVETKGGNVEKLEMLTEACRKEIGDGDGDKCQTAKLIIECFIKYAKQHKMNDSQHV